jgi:hypothetical protein
VPHPAPTAMIANITTRTYAAPKPVLVRSGVPQPGQFMWPRYGRPTWHRIGENPTFIRFGTNSWTTGFHGSDGESWRLPLR